ncbi:MAG: hypothetical protein CL931_08435 [Deltaproteobacteria bacterium]|nr:hypothetical protein [Deltaproteobacteria bacterium]
MPEGPRSGQLLEIVYPEDTNSQGTLFGGHALARGLDRALAACHRGGRTTSTRGGRWPKIP